MQERRHLALGVIRDPRYYRANNAQKERWDAEFRARRPHVMNAAKWRCAFCGYQAESNECHHLDGNHANNVDANLVPADGLCHGYHHLGQRAASERNAADNLGERTRLAAVPELSPQDLNLLQRMIGAALLDEKEAPTAKAMLKRLAARCKPVGDAFGTYMPGDFAAAMVKMDDESYQTRDSVIGRLRLLFRDDYLVNQGQKFVKDFPALPVNTWEGIAANADRTEGSSAATAG